MPVRFVLQLFERSDTLSFFIIQMKECLLCEGVLYLKDMNIDILLVTLNAEKDYSPTTMYNDYSISEYLFHWQSQSNDLKPLNGQRYINHKNYKYTVRESR